MAKVRSNPIIQGLSGKLGDQLVFRHLRDGRTIVCVKPDFSRRVLSRDQKAHHAKFRAAAAYARGAAKKQPIYAELAAGTMKTAYNVALSDFFHPPIIHQVKMKDGVIRVEASDNVQVTTVRVKISNTDGVILEQGEAAPGAALWWSYAPQITLESTFKVEVDAYDLARNVTKWGTE
jgi:hypothetical protein